MEERNEKQQAESNITARMEKERTQSLYQSPQRTQDEMKIFMLSHDETATCVIVYCFMINGDNNKSGLMMKKRK